LSKYCSVKLFSGRLIARRHLRKGLGKTVQVIALFCALFGKTGTVEDLKTMRERKKKVSAHIQALQSLADEALTKGEVVEEDDNEWRKSLDMSPWHPVLVLVPPSVMEAWKQSFELFSYFSVSVYSSKTGTKAIEAVRYGSSDVLLCPKSLFQSEVHFNIINNVKWKLVVIDEFHNYKSETAKVSKNLRELKLAHIPLVLGMTGYVWPDYLSLFWDCYVIILNCLSFTERSCKTIIRNCGIWLTWSKPTFLGQKMTSVTLLPIPSRWAGELKI
jgi:SNF2 family DNA or RNA helicase